LDRVIAKNKMARFFASQQLYRVGHKERCCIAGCNFVSYGLV